MLEMNQATVIQLIAAIIGGVIAAAIGVKIVGFFGGFLGAIVGALLPILIPLAVDYQTENAEIKRKILTTLESVGRSEVRDVMRLHGVSVPTDAFEYSDGHPFVIELSKYKNAFTELEADHKLIFLMETSIQHGYVDPIGHWVNSWSGRMYEKSP